MMKLRVVGALASVLLAMSLTAATAESGQRVEFMVQSGDQSWMNSGPALDPSALRAKFGRHFAAMARDGRTFVVTDRLSLDRLRQLYAPVAEIGRQQADLGSKQALLGSEQARIGEQQAIIGARQAALAAAEEDGGADLSARQHELGEKQRALGARQRVLGEQQRVLGERQRELERQTRPQIERLFDDAIGSGTAIEVR